jgi:cell division protein FtsQ
MIATSDRIVAREGTTGSRRMGMNARKHEQTQSVRRAEKREKILEKAGSMGVGLAGAVLTVLVVVASGWYGWKAFAKSEFASLATIELSGFHRTTPDQLAVLTGLKAGRPLSGLDLDAVRKRLEADPWIADARVSRRWPRRVRIELVERIPVGRLATGALVSVDGVVLPRRGQESFPLLVGQGYKGGRIPMKRAVESLSTLRQMELAGLSDRIEQISLVSDGSMELRLAGTVPAILVGPLRWKQSLARVAALRRELGDDISRFSEIDLRHGACAALRRADGGL